MKEKPDTSVKKRTLLQKIVNVFLGIGIGILFLLLVFFAFSQTATFRNYLKNYIVNSINSSMENSKFSIEELQGTLLTSIILRNVVLEKNNIQVLNFDKMEIKLDPLQIFSKHIYFSKFEIRYGEINLINHEDGRSNSAKSTIPDSANQKSKYPFNFIFADLRLSNINLNIKNEHVIERKLFYDTLNVKDLRLSNLTLQSSANADLNKNEYNLNIEKLDFIPNIKKFGAALIRSSLFISPRELLISDFNLQTDSSNISVNLEQQGLNILSDPIASFESSIVHGSLKIERFNFSELSKLFPELKDYKGTAKAALYFEGEGNSLNFKHITIQYNKSEFQITGTVNNPLNDNLRNISAEFKTAKLFEPDLNSLMPLKNIPVYDSLGIVTFDTLTFKGNFKNFKSNLSLKSKYGKIKGKLTINSIGPRLVYSGNFTTKNLDLFPFIGMSSDISSEIKLQGVGTDPAGMNAQFSIASYNPTLNKVKIDSIKFVAEAINKNILYKFIATDKISSAELSGLIDFSKEHLPVYDVEAKVVNFNPQKYFRNIGYYGNVNFYLNASGESFELDNMDLYLKMMVANSELNGINIDSTKATIDIRKDKNGVRLITVNSNLADMKISSDLSLNDAFKLLSFERENVSSILRRNISQTAPAFLKINYSNDFNQNKISSSEISGLSSSLSKSVHYNINFKDFTLLSIFLGNNLELDGEVKGYINLLDDELKIFVNTNLEYLKFWGKDGVFFLSKLLLNFNLENNLFAENLNEIASKVSIRTNRIFAGKDIHNFFFNLNLKNNNANIQTSVNFEDLSKIDLAGNINLNNSQLDVDLSKLIFTYNNFELVNKDNINFLLSKEDIKVNRFVFTRNNAELDISGSLSNNYSSQINFRFKNLDGKDISVNLLKLNPIDAIESKINLNGKLYGNVQSPNVDFTMNADNLTFHQRKLGSFHSVLNYNKSGLLINTRMVDTVINSNNTTLSIKGVIPKSIIWSDTSSVYKNEQMNIDVKANKFSIETFGDVFSEVKKMSGFLNADLKISGRLNDISPEGFLSIEEGKFLFTENNLMYSTRLKLNVKNNYVSIDTWEINNLEKTEITTGLVGSGDLRINNFDITSANLMLNGNIKLLGIQSKSVSPYVYGDLFVKSRGNISLTNNGGYTFLDAPVDVQKADLTFPLSQVAFSNKSFNFIYKFKESKKKDEVKGIEFDSLIAISRNLELSSGLAAARRSSFDYRIDLNADKETKLVFILSKEINQNLTAFVKGNIHYEVKGQRTHISGKLDLLEGSNLAFIKRFDATGTVEFDNSLTNPILNVLATYQDYYYPLPDQNSAENTGNIEEVPVAVKIKLKGPLRELGKNFVKDPKNISVYYGENNIQNDVPDYSYDVNDAVMFVLSGQFKSKQTGYNTAAESKFLASKSTALAGSILGGFLTSYTGDYIRSIDLRTVGSTTKFNLLGRINKFRYSIGGTTEIFQDLSQANVKIEYPFYQRLLLRLERKQSVSETTIQNDMINEVGLKYKFEF